MLATALYIVVVVTITFAVTVTTEAFPSEQ